MASSTLSLYIDSGPKKVKTLECKPGDLIHIGRVVRGNTLAIRDPSISEKHLTIRFLPEVTLWVVTDLGSSNGTYVSGALISRDHAVPLADGDVIRIGERTSISVHIFAPQAGTLPLPRCGGPNKAVAPDENKENKPKKIDGKRMARGRMRKNNVLQPVVTDHRIGRVTRASARAGSTSISGVKVMEDMTIIMSDSESAEGLAEEMPIKKNIIGSEEEEPGEFGKKEARDEEVEDDLDNMTLDEWFHRMEEYLPKEINKVAEEIIANLRKKSSLFDEYISQVSNVTDE